jgi:2-C-methyl-D-erythritol 2,4-cyclodiphosphate synthase
MGELRVGCGYDIHAFTSGRPLVLGGVTIEHNRGLAGHSDADVLTHAVVDALLGAVGWGDLGDWFPTSDPRYRDANSLTFLDQVAYKLRGGGWRVLNLDTTLVAQEPHLSPQRGPMRDCLAQRLGIEAKRVSVKSTTADHLGSIGRAEGIAAHAVVLLEAPNRESGAGNQEPGVGSSRSGVRSRRSGARGPGFGKRLPASR